MFTRRVKTVAQLERALGHPVLGTLPHLRVRSTGVSTLAGDSDRARAARALTANVAVLDPRALLVSAPAGGHGRSIVVASLAVGFAERGDATLALELDGGGQLGRLLGAAAAPNGGTVSVRTALDYGVACDDWSAYARVLGNGRTLGDAAFAEIARRFDGVLLVIRAGTLGGDDVRRLLGSIDGAELVGAVLTDAGGERPAPRRAPARPAEPPSRVAKHGASLAARERALDELGPEPAAAGVPPASDAATPRWSLAALEAAVARVAATDPERAVELRFYLDALADHADADGRLSEGFADLIRRTFGDLV